MIGAWLTGLAIDLAQGASRRSDRGLFSPATLRVWGIVFALIPLGLLGIAWSTILHPQVLLWFWGAAIACFTLAARRARSRELADPTNPIG